MKTTHSWTVTVWGTRGAVPMAGADYLEFGGDTSCISVDCGNELVVFDAGSGIVHLNPALEGNGLPERIDILISHLHLDHIQGLVGFPPLFNPAADIHIYGEARDGVSFRTCIDRIFGAPYWPFGLKDTDSCITVHEIAPEARFSLAKDLTVSTLRSFHPNMSMIYRLEGRGRSIVYTPDCELTDEMAPSLTDFARDCDLLIWDANSTAADLQRGWGHSTWEQGLDIARAAGAGRVMMTHYDRSYTDAFLRKQERLAKQKCDTCIFAREGMEIEL